jgi:CDP-4-dehydro-6-deoxyglucose reductase
MAQSGELSTFDGQVELSEVLRAFPDARFENDSEIRRVEEIKDAALTKSQSRQGLPDAAILARRLDELGRDFARLDAQVHRHERVHGMLGERIKSLIEDGAISPNTGDELLRWFRRELATLPSDAARSQRLVSRERLMRVMSAQVKVLPRGVVFEAQGSETLLEAGLRAGLSFSYGCSNGNCGKCKALVVSGEVTKVRPHDYVLTDAEKAKGVTLMCSNAAVGDIVIEAAMAGVSDITGQVIDTRVRAVESLGTAVFAVHLLTPRSDRLCFLAGQRVRARVGDDEAELSIASCPCEERRIELHVRRDRADAFAAHVERELRVNDVVELIGPFGDFVLDETSVRPLIFVAEDEGYAPIKSLIQHALSLDHAPSIALYRLAGAIEPYQENLPRSYASALDNFSYVVFPANAAQKESLLRIASEENFAASDVYAAGSAEFIANTRALFFERGLTRERWHAETVGEQAAKGVSVSIE